MCTFKTESGPGVRRAARKSSSASPLAFLLIEAMVFQAVFPVVIVGYEW